MHGIDAVKYCDMENIRVSAKAIITHNGKLLTMHHRDADSDYYLLPGGGQRNGESLISTLERECMEEAGVKVMVRDVLYIRDYIADNHEFAEFSPGFHQVEIMFQCQLLDSSKIGQGKEMDERQIGVSWLPIDELDQHPLYPAILKKVLRKNYSKSTYLGDVN